MALHFNNYAAKGNEYLNALTRELELEQEDGNEIAGNMTKAVFRVLRNQISVEESFQLMAQLPMMLKAVYIEEWQPFKKQEHIKYADAFVETVMDTVGAAARHAFPDRNGAKWAVKAVFKALSQYISKGEFEDLEAVLPKDVKLLLKESISYSKKHVKI